jgi:hypothetical protein
MSVVVDAHVVVEQHVRVHLEPFLKIFNQADTWYTHTMALANMKEW